MAYGGTKSFFTQGYIVDYTNKKIKVEESNTKLAKFFDFTGNYIIQILLYSVIFVSLLWLINKLIYIPQETNYVIFTIGTIIILTFFLFFNFYYTNNVLKKSSDLQMLFEAPLYFFKETTEIEIQLNNTIEIEIHLENSYWKYWLTFKGECTEYRDKIIFLHFLSEDDVKIIRFKKPVNGTIKMKYKAGKVTKIVMR